MPAVGKRQEARATRRTSGLSRGEWFALSLGAIAAALSVGLPAMLNGRPPDRTLWLIGGAVLVGGTAVMGLLVLTYRLVNPEGVTRPEAIKDRREQIHAVRWRYALGGLPAMCSVIAISCLNMARELTGGPSLLAAMLVLAAPLMGIAAAGTILVRPPVKPGRPGSRLFYFYNDELSREHAGRATRTGFYGLVVGLAAVLAAALFRPGWVIPAAIGALWLGSVALSVHYGLLQRAAELDAADDEEA